MMFAHAYRYHGTPESSLLQSASKWGDPRQSLAVNIHCEFSSRFHSDRNVANRREFTTFSRNSMASRILVAFSQ